MRDSTAALKETMKRLFRAVAIAAALVMFVGGSAYADKTEKTQKEIAKIEKQAEKDAKARAKELKKAGWKAEGSGTLETMLADHLAKMRINDLEERAPESNGNKTQSMARKKIRNAVTVDYAREMTEAIKGVVSQEASSLEGSEAENFTEAVESRIAMDLAGEIKESFAIVREKNGKYDMKIFYLIDPENAQASRLRAIKFAEERTKVSQNFRDAIHKAVEGK